MTREIDFEVVKPKTATVEVKTPAPKAAEVQLPGVPGVPGRSAYQQAVDAGFEGTLEEWLDSLRGEPGTPGKDGLPGKDGYSPVRGVDYFTPEDIEAIVDAVVARFEDGDKEAY